MTAKRFNRVGGYVYDGEKCISHFEDVKHRDDIVKLLNELHEENQLLKQALRESLEDGGNAYVIDLLDKIFDLKYCEWQKKMNDTHTYDYVEWEEILEQKRDDVE